MKLFNYSIGPLLLAIATSLFLVNLTSPVGFISPPDPIFNISITSLFWVVAGVTLMAALACLFDRKTIRPLYLVIWISANFIVYKIGAQWQGCHGFAGYLDGFSRAFGISVTLADLLSDLLFGYLAVISVLLLRSWWANKAELRFHKMACPNCGGHIKFAPDGVGTKMPCPHCQAAITLRRPEYLKAACYFCKGHIEFPSHALGHKAKCPHCNMEITLQHVGLAI